MPQAEVASRRAATGNLAPALVFTLAMLGGAMLGGAGSLWGPIIGAGILIPLKSYLKEWLGATAGLVGIDLIIYALIIMLVSAFEPRGIWGIIDKIRRRKRN